jgi:DNA (cytosine-5)-methyltransferase 1
MTHGSLFSGIGGFDLAASWMGWENIFHCEWNEFGQKVLKYYWPDAESFTDITKTDFTKYANRIDILTGGFPCQPYSLAGKRKGKEDERHLWPEMLRAIREIQPRWVVGENVFGLINWSDGLVFHEVQTDLEAAGYEVWPYVLPAVSVNAPHRRDRVWFVAHSNSCRNNRAKGSKESIWQYEDKKQQRSGGAMQINGLGNERAVTNSNSNGQHGSNSMHEINASEGREHALNDFEQTALYSDSTIKQGQHIGQQRERESNGPSCRDAVNGWKNFPTQSPICTRNDGLSARLDGITFPKWRNESIKAAGNAIVPQVALQIFKAIEQYEQQNS